MKYPDEFLNKVICGNSSLIMKEIPNKSIKLICTDPPYFMESCKGGGIAAKRDYFKEIDKNDIDIGFDFKTLEEYKRILINMNLITFCGKNELREYLNWIHENNYRFVLITWNKTNPIPLIDNNYLPDTEYIFHIWDGNNVKLNGSYATKKKYYLTPIYKNKFDHPTVKPLEIVQNLIINATDSQDIVLDPYCGSGTTLVACKILKRNFIGIDNKQKYVDMSYQRLNEVENQNQKQKSLFDSQ